MKLCAVSPFKSASREEILSFLQRTTADLVILPGFSKENTPLPEEIREVIHRGVAVFVELGSPDCAGKTKTTPYLVTRARSVPMPRGTYRGKGKASRASGCAWPTAKDMDKLVEACRERTFPIGSRKVTFVICGEITGFNPDGTMKHRRRLQFDILANPVHTIMRRWYWLGPKLSALSKGRTVVHVANNPGNHGNLSTDLRIYIDGKLQDRRVKRGEPLKWCECVI